jgi:hypothetical protein
MMQARVWAVAFLLLVFGQNKSVLGQNFDPKIAIVSYGANGAQNNGDCVYQQQTIGSAIGQFIQDRVRIKNSPSHLTNNYQAHYKPLTHGQISVEQTYPYLSEFEFRVLFGREIELGLTTPEQVLRLYNLYKYPQFMSYIKNLSGYSDLVLDINKQLNSLMGAQWFLKASGLSKKSAKLLLAARAQEVLREREAQARAQAAKREQAELERQRRIAAYCPPESLARCIEQWQEQEDREQENSVHNAPGARYKKRLSAVRELAEGRPAVTREYTLSARAKALLEQLDLEQLNFTKLCGDQLQQVLHAEFLDLMDTVVDMQDSCAQSLTARDLTVFLVSCIDTGCQANKQGDTAYASKIADFCWTAAGKIGNICIGFAEGIAQIVVGTAHAVMHPLDTAWGIGQALNVVIPLFMEMVMATGDHPSFDVNIEYGNFKRSLDPDRADQVVQFFDKLAASAQQASCRDVAREATAFIAPLFAGKLCSAAAKCVGAINARVPGAVRLAFAGAPDAVELAAVAQGVEIGFSGNALEVFAESEVAQARATALMQEGLQSEQAAAGVLESFASETKAMRAVEIEPVIANVHAPLENTHAALMFEVKQEVNNLRPIFDSKIKGTAEFSNKYMKIDYEHILGMELKNYQKKQLKIGGFHLDPMNKIENSGIFEFKNKVISPNGVYKADVMYNGKIAKWEGTFFPADWSREKVISKIYEAYDNFIKNGGSPDLMRDRKYKVEGFTQEGIKVVMHITENGLITSAYPKLN